MRGELQGADGSGVGRGHHPVPPWTPRDQTMLRTAQVMHAYTHGEFDRIHGIPVDFAVAGVPPDNRILVAAPFRRAVYRADGDGSYQHQSGFFFATGRYGLAMTAGAMLGQYVGNQSRRRHAAQRAQQVWRPQDEGTVYVNQFGFHLRHRTALLWWSWVDILECRMLGPGQLGMLGLSTEGQMNYHLESDAAELIFATWALVRQPQHPQFQQRIWLAPGWMEHYRAVVGAQAYPFDTAP